MNEINHELGIIALESCRELGQQVNKIIQQKRNTEESFLIPTNEIRFSNGEGKVKLPETVRGKDIYILCDVGNYSCTYKMFGFTNHKGPDEEIPESHAMAAYAEEHGVPQSDIIIEDRSKKTNQNLKFSHQLMQPDSTFCIVTNSYHVYRALVLAKRQRIS